MLSDQELLQYVPEKGLLKGRVILVTGASDGIGKAISIAYARYGATVVLLSKNIKPLEAVYDAILAAGGPEPAIYPLDMEGANVDDYNAMAQMIKMDIYYLYILLHGESQNIIYGIKWPKKIQLYT